PILIPRLRRHLPCRPERSPPPCSNGGGEQSRGCISPRGSVRKATRFDERLGIIHIVFGAEKMRRAIVKQKALSREEQVDYLVARHFSGWPDGLFSLIARNPENKDIGSDSFLESVWSD